MHLSFCLAAAQALLSLTVAGKANPKHNPTPSWFLPLRIFRLDTYQPGNGTDKAGKNTTIDINILDTNMRDWQKLHAGWPPSGPPIYPTKMTRSRRDKRWEWMIDRYSSHSNFSIIVSHNIRNWLISDLIWARLNVLADDKTFVCTVEPDETSSCSLLKDVQIKLPIYNVTMGPRGGTDPYATD